MMENSKSFHVIEQENLHEFFNNQCGFKIEAEEEGSGLGMWSSYTGKYYLVIETPVSENLVGISQDNTRKFRVPWELIREEKAGNNRYMIFTGWGDSMNGGHQQFEGCEIGIASEIILKIIKAQMNSYPEFFSLEKVKNFNGLENYNLG